MKQGKKIRTIALLAGASTLIGMGSAYAAMQAVTAHIKFVTDITVAETQFPDFGLVKAGVAGASYVLSTAGGITPGGGGVAEGGVPKAGAYTVTASAGTPMELYADTYTAGTNGTVPTAATCDYNAGGSAACGTVGSPQLIAAPIASATLLVGLTDTDAAGLADGVSDNPSFDLHVLYQ